MSARPVLRVLRPGPLTTVQDLGRPRAQALGVPGGGAMDPVALRIANRLAGNGPGAAALEIALGGFEAEFLCDVDGALAGADLGAEPDGGPLEPGHSFRAKKGSRLRFLGRRWGGRAYLTVGGGIAVPEVLGSRSTYLPGAFGGLEGRELRAGDVLEAGGTGEDLRSGRREVPADLVPPYAPAGGVAVLRAVRGPQDAAFTNEGLWVFFGEVFDVSARADRMGCQLDRPPIGHRTGPDILSDGVAWGSVQVPGNGNPILLLADRQTTGGYAKIATVAAVDLPLAGQLVPGDRVRFEEVDLWRARVAWAAREVRLRAWEAGPAPPRRAGTGQ